MHTQDFYSASEISKKTGIARRTLYSWREKGLISWTEKSGISRKQVEAIIEEKKQNRGRGRPFNVKLYYYDRKCVNEKDVESARYFFGRNGLDKLKRMLFVLGKEYKEKDRFDDFQAALAAAISAHGPRVKSDGLSG
ncbi:hypothetical protein QQ056_17125 [Oscillatoria laete-virens NRMC-F 0139]|nr:hypothetical protein [Oscillatoria laete-virens]MDL5055256.1 hypothetical protein [Oscillatoria laete-virens NRMC-F 0139]